jgi:tRNA G18 (ribose-2'-O)-methylase SpoU
MKVVLILHNVRSCHNVGSMLRTANGLGIECVYLTGYTPYPQSAGDIRLPHLSHKIDHQIAKTSLGAEKSVHWEHCDDIYQVLDKLRKQGYLIAALEQKPGSTVLPSFLPPDKIVLIVGSEVGGIDENILEFTDKCLEIPMMGKKESFNVAVAAAIALYHLKHIESNR